MTTWNDITTAVAAAQGGDKLAALSDLTRCWEGTDQTDHARRCVVAHYIADLQTNIDDEVAWDERALTEHRETNDTDLAPIDITSTAAMLPSLLLNLGDGYLRQGRIEDARRVCDEAVTSAQVLPEEGYGALIRKGILGLRKRVIDAESR